MPSDLPIACSLTAAELPLRLAEMREVGRSALIGVEQSVARAVLRFRRAGETGERLGAIVAAEARCCAFLDIRLHDDGEALVLTIGAPSEARPVLDELVAAFAGP